MSGPNGTRKPQILAAATRCFARHGYHATSVGMIIAEAKVARGTFYLHFTSKKAIFDELLDGFLADISMAVRKIVIPHDPRDLWPSLIEQIRGNVARVLDVLLESRDLAKILLSEAMGADKGYDARLKEFYRNLLAFAELSIARGVGIGVVRPLDPRLGATFTLGAVKEMIYRQVILREPEPQREHLVDEILAFLSGALLTDQAQVTRVSAAGKGRAAPTAGLTKQPAAR
jgi:AcrR family transcriptional regulator